MSLKKIISTKFARGFMLLFGGNAIAQAIALITVPITARLFGPENFGELALITSTISIMASISSFCYERAIVLPSKDEDAATLLILSFTVMVLFCLVMLLISIYCQSKYSYGLNERVFRWATLVPLGIFLFGSQKILQFWLIRIDSIKTIAAANIGNTIVSAFIKIAFGFIIGTYTSGLILGYFIGAFIALAILFSNLTALRRIKKCLKNLSIKRLLQLSIKYKQFPLFSTSNVFLNMFSRNINVYLITMLFTASVVGYYSMSLRILQQPIQVFSMSLQNVYFRKAASDIRKKTQLVRNFKKLTIYLAAAGILPFLFLGLFAKKIFIFIFGINWEVAGIYCQILAPWFFMLFVSAPSNVIFEVCQKQRVRFAINIFTILASATSIILGYTVFETPEKTLICFVASNVIIQLILIIIAYSIANNIHNFYKASLLVSSQD